MLMLHALQEAEVIFIIILNTLFQELNAKLNDLGPITSLRPETTEKPETDPK